MRGAYFLGLCALLIVVQVRGLVVQVKDGYRPFGAPAHRVPYSWDMFAVDLDRCTVAWDPPLSIDGKPVARWRDRGVPLEWDSVTTAPGYEELARDACRYRSTRATTVKLVCVQTNGEVRESAFACP